MRVVKNSLGQYAIKRRFWIFTEYLDLVCRRFWWRRSDPHFPDCWGTKEMIIKRFGQLIALKSETAVSLKELLEEND